MRILAEETTKKIGETILVQGWVNTRRDHGGVIFVDLRDHTGLAQIVFNPDDAKMFKEAENLRDEFCISVVGKVRERGEGLTNPNIASGAIEIVAENLEILNKSEVLPVATRDEGQQSNEDLRFKYRFLDLRRPYLQNVLKKRAEFNHFLRDYMEAHDYTEVVTPILANSSPEGARDFLIPSRLHPGEFYALPQAPQQFKQLLMVAGLSKYYQIATCFRDEDSRADRLYGEFYQLDLERSFVDDGEVIRAEMEPLIKNLVTDFGGKKLVNKYAPAMSYADSIGGSSKTKSIDSPDRPANDGAEASANDKTFIPRISYVEAMETYGTDKPDLRYYMKLIDLTETFAKTDFKVFQTECVKAICVKNGASLSRAQIDNFTEIARKEGAGGLAYIMYENGEAKSPIAKFLTAEELEQIKQKTGAENSDAVFFGADKRELVNKVLGKLRIEFADFLNLKNPDEVALCWITDFPFYEWEDGAKKVDFGHNPFSMPRGGLTAVQNAKTDEEKLAIVADQYDMVMNGYEICSGGVRNHNPEILYEVFAKLGYSREYVEQKFGAMLTAFKFGAPPHAGCAFGLDRIFMVLMGTENIRDIVPFPKNGQGVDLMMSSPGTVFPEQLEELNIEIKSE